VIKCTKINPSEKVFSLIIVTIANAKRCVHGSRKKNLQEGLIVTIVNYYHRQLLLPSPMPKAVFMVVGKIFYNFYRRGTRGVFQNFSGRGPKVVKNCFFPTRNYKKTSFLLKCLNPGVTKAPLPPFRRPWLCLNTQCSNNNNLAYALFLLSFRW